eukprot:15088928-Ditylum_brightwellii.AAC.1
MDWQVAFGGVFGAWIGCSASIGTVEGFVFLCAIGVELLWWDVVQLGGGGEYKRRKKTHTKILCT